jgi:hypothetical protein
MQQSKKIIILFLSILSFSNSIVAQQIRQAMSQDEIAEAKQNNRLKGVSIDFGMENEFVVIIKEKQITKTDADRIVASLKGIAGVFFCNFNATDYSLVVKSKSEYKEEVLDTNGAERKEKSEVNEKEKNDPELIRQKKADAKKYTLLNISQIKQVLFSFGIDINACEEKVYKSKN